MALRQKVFADQVEYLFTQLMTSLIAVTFLTGFVAFAMLDAVSETVFYLWVLLNIAIVLLRYAFLHSYRGKSAPDSKHYYRLFFGGTMLSALFWGGATFFFFIPDSSDHQAFLSFVYAGLVAGAAISLSSRREIYIAYAVIILAPLMYHFTLSSNPFAYHFSGMVLLFLLFLIFSSLKYSRIIEEGIRRKYENSDLVEQLRSSQRAIEDASRQLDDILNHIDSIVLMNDRDGVLQFLNQKFFERFDFSDLDAFKQAHESIAELFISAEGYLQARMDGVAWSQYVLNHPDMMHKAMMRDRSGNERIFAVTAQTVKTRYSHVVVVTLGDITELEYAKIDAQAAARMKGEFLANMSHEIRTPMNAILGFATLMKKCELQDKPKRYLEIIDSSTHQLLGIINDILDFSRLESGYVEIDRTPVNLKTEMTNLAALFTPAIEDKKITFDLIVDASLPECLETDLLRLKQIVSNLLGNAVKFTYQEGKIALHVEQLQRTQESVRVQFGVIDTGIGIPSDKLESIFDAFSQADGSTTRHFGGTGLGLSISTRLVKMMGGSLHVKSEEGKGSHFYFDLPMSFCSAETETDETSAPSPNVPAEAEVDPMRVLIAEDNKFNQMLVEEMLLTFGVTSIIANNGIEAVDAVLQAPFDLILMDINMPEMSGVDALHKIRENGITTPVIALTANAMEGDKESFLASGFDGYLAKPLEIAKLEGVLQSYGL